MGATRKNWQTPMLAETTVREVLLECGAQSQDRFGPPGWSNEGTTIAGPIPAPLFGAEAVTLDGPFGPPVFGPPIFGPPVFGPPGFGPQPPSPAPSDLPVLMAGPFGPPNLDAGAASFLGPNDVEKEIYGPPTAPLFGPPPAPLFGPSVPSDLRLKENVRQIGTTAHELPLYNFRYRGRDGVYEGVMAQDVLAVRPDAVLTGADGFYSVDYGRLGVTFRRIQ